MLSRVVNIVIRAPRIVLGAAVLIAVLCGAYGATVVSHLGSGGFYDPHSESMRAIDVLNERFHEGPPNLVLLVKATGGVDGPAARAAGQRATSMLQARSDVEAVNSYWTAPPGFAGALRSKDQRSAIVAARITGDDTTAQNRAADIARTLSGTHNGVTIRVGGEAFLFHELNAQITKDLFIAETVAIPLTALLLTWAFGSLVAALLPLALGMFSMVWTLASLRGLTAIADVSIYALNLTVALGLALSIDYSLFMVNRFREEMNRGLSVEDAVRQTARTAGRTVLFSALPVALSLSVLLVFPSYFLRSFAYAGVAVVVAAALASFVFLPAALVLLGNRVNSLDLRVPVRRLLRRPPPGVPVPEQSMWYRVAATATRAPLRVFLVVVAGLLLLGSPFLRVHPGVPDDRVIAGHVQSRQVGDGLRHDFAQDPTTSMVAVLPDYHGDPAALGSYASALSRVGGVTSVGSAAGTFASGRRVAAEPPGVGSAAFLNIGTSTDPFSSAGAAQLDRLRATPSPGRVLFTGTTAINGDSTKMLSDKLPTALALIALVTFAILFLFTGSFVLPLKAIALNTLSLTATFGAMVWVFQDGRMTGLLGYTHTGWLVPPMLVLMFCLAFGVSMDYEIFVLSRIREEWLASGRTSADNTRAIALGVARAGRIITAAACLMAIAFGAMVSSHVSFIKMVGLGLTLAVLVDAAIVRSLLVPSFMQLMGRFNWWAPSPAARLHRRIGLSESAPEEKAPTVSGAGRARAQKIPG